MCGADVTDYCRANSVAETGWDKYVAEDRAAFAAKKEIFMSVDQDSADEAAGESFRELVSGQQWE